MKGIHYVATVVKAYREAIDAHYQKRPADDRPRWDRDLAAVNNRGFDTGFYFGAPVPTDSETATPPAPREYRLVGKVLADAAAPKIPVETRNRFFTGESVEIISPEGPIRSCRIDSIRDTDGRLIDRARPGFQVRVGLSVDCRRGDLLRTVRAAAPPAVRPSRG